MVSAINNQSKVLQLNRTRTHVRLGLFLISTNQLIFNEFYLRSNENMHVKYEMLERMCKLICFSSK